MENFEESEKNFEEKISEINSRIYSDWDEFQITLISKNSAVGTIKMERRNMDSIIEFHNSRAETLDMLFQLIVEERQNKMKEDERES